MSLNNIMIQDFLRLLYSYVTEHYYDTGLSEVVMSLNNIMI